MYKNDFIENTAHPTMDPSNGAASQFNGWLVNVEPIDFRFDYSPSLARSYFNLKLSPSCYFELTSMVCSACCIFSFKIHNSLRNRWWLTLLQLYHMDNLIIGHSNVCYKTYFNSQRTSHQSSYSFVKEFTGEIDKNKFTIYDFLLITACWKAAFLHNLFRPG